MCYDDPNKILVMLIGKNISIHHNFKANKFLKLFKRVFPKFKGFWLPCKYLFKIFPSKMEAIVNFDDFQFNVPLDLQDTYQLDIFLEIKKNCWNHI